MTRQIDSHENELQKYWLAMNLGCNAVVVTVEHYNE